MFPFAHRIKRNKPNRKTFFSPRGEIKLLDQLVDRPRRTVQSLALHSNSESAESTKVCHSYQRAEPKTEGHKKGKAGFSFRRCSFTDWNWGRRRALRRWKLKTNSCNAANTETTLNECLGRGFDCMMTKLFITRHKPDNKLVVDTMFQFEESFLFQLNSRIALLSLKVCGVHQLILRMVHHHPKYHRFSFCESQPRQWFVQVICLHHFMGVQANRGRSFWTKIIRSRVFKQIAVDHYLSFRVRLLSILHTV